ncbi:hypothetical protein CKY04_20525 [Photorhabdus sp. S8-52]|nr:hypothetical protein CKY03_20845 [Photorhabdus sp. S9-53]RAW94230.1 hypothetical protein CKY05_20630 [Photorhabdus sp. S10-54]RAW97896.1 hypothetical protein CKY04_20525 [Photorhabdus sp. S8-52]
MILIFDIEKNGFFSEISSILVSLFVLLVIILIFIKMFKTLRHDKPRVNIPVIFQVASLLAVLTHPGHIVIYAPKDSLPCRRDAS